MNGKDVLDFTLLYLLFFTLQTGQFVDGGGEGIPYPLNLY